MFTLLHYQFNADSSNRRFELSTFPLYRREMLHL